MSIDLYSNKQEAPMWKKVLFIFSIVLTLIIIILFTFNQFVKIPKNDKMISDINSKLSKQGTPEQLVQKEMVLGAEKKINIFKEMYTAKHVFAKFFNEFDTWVYPRVVFSSLDINVENAELTLKAQTDSLQSVMQQMLLLDAKTNISSYTVSNIQIGDNGKTSFDLKLNVNSELFKNNEQ